MEQSFVDLIKAGEAMKAEIAALKAKVEQLKVVPFIGAGASGKFGFPKLIGRPQGSLETARNGV